MIQVPISKFIHIYSYTLSRDTLLSKDYILKYRSNELEKWR